MFFKRIVYTVFIMLFLMAGYSKANNLDKTVYSTVLLPITISKIVKCDRVKARFEVYAEGDSYNMALKRLKKVNNDFISFLKKQFTDNEIQTKNIYGYSKNAAIYVSIDTNKIKRIQSALRYILNRNFEYKTGIKPIDLNLYISNELEQKIEDTLFRQLLKISKEKLKETNTILGDGYAIKDIDINFNAYNPIVYRNNLTLYKSSSVGSKGAINISQGSKKIKLNAKVKMIKQIN